MIQINNLKKSYGGRTVLEDISLTISSGEKCGLVGRNGSGKSTLFRLITGKEESNGGTISFPKHYKIGYLDQHIIFSKNSLLEEGATGLPPQDKDSLYKVESILQGLGFSYEDFEKKPTDFSGGYQLRLHLAKVLLSDPDCLLLDEPTNYLDIISIAWLEKFLKAWRKELILISHDREFMDRVTTHTIGIHRKKIRKIAGNTENYFSQILLEEEVHEKTRLKIEQKKAKSENFIKRYGAKATKAKQAQSKLKAINKLPTLEKLAMMDDLDFSFNYSFFPSKQMVNVESIDFSYDPSKGTLINNFELEVLQEDCIAIIGKNGRGKSTLAKLLSGELTPIKGSIKRAEKLQIGYFGQTNIDRLNKSHTIEEEIMLANPNLSIGEVRRICGVMMFSGDDAKKTISVLSGGERSRVLLGKILATPCNFLILDEPTHHLDMESIESLITAINEFQGAVVIVTHSEMLLNELPITKLIVCHHEMQEVIIGDYDDFLSRGGWTDEESFSFKTKIKEDSKDEKKRVAEAKQERARLLKPLHKKMLDIESEIESLEKKLDKNNDLLIEASTAEQGDLIRKFSKEIFECQKKIDELFKELESTSLEIKEVKERFPES